MNEVASILRHFREQADMTQSELAERIGISQGFLGHIEKGRKAVSVPMAIKIEQALGTKCPAEALSPLLQEFLTLYLSRNAT